MNRLPPRPRTLWFFLPAYHEEQNLPPLLQALRATIVGWDNAPRVEVAVIDDGSMDGTGRAAMSVPGISVTVITHQVNRGLGAAVRTGIEWALERANDDDFVATMDADNTHPPELLPAMVARADAGADLVIASRYREGAQIHGLVRWRRWLSDAASLVFRAVFPCGARDFTCGYRVYRAGLLRWGQRRYGPHFLNQRGFSVMVDLLLKLRRRARRIDEVPLILRYDRKVGASKMKVVKTIVTTLRLLGRRFVGDPTGP